MRNCSCLSEFLKVEKNLIRLHLPGYASRHDIDDRTQAMACFIRDYGGLMRSIYCGRICRERGRCPGAHDA